MEVGNWKLGGICLPGPTYDPRRQKPRSSRRQATETQKLKCIQLVGVVSDARTPERVINPVVRIGRGVTLVSHRRFRHTEAQRHRDDVNVAWLWGGRVARALRATGRATADHKRHNGLRPLVTAVPLAPSVRPGGPGATGSCPRVSTCGSAFPRSAVCDQSSSCAVDRTLPSRILGASAPRCVVDSVRSGPAADPLNTLGVDSAA